MPPKLVRPQTFTVFQQSDSASPAVRLESSSCESFSSTETATLDSFFKRGNPANELSRKTELSRNLTSWFKYFTCSNTREQNLIDLLVEVLFADLVFVYRNIVQEFSSSLFKDVDKSNSSSYIQHCFPECLSLGVSPSVHTARLIAGHESLQQEER